METYIKIKGRCKVLNSGQPGGGGGGAGTVGFALKLFWVDRRSPGTYRGLIFQKSPKVYFLYCFIFKIFIINTFFSIKSIQ